MQENAIPQPRENGSRRSPTSNFLWMQGRGRRTPWRRNLCWLYTFIVPGYEILFLHFKRQSVIEPNPNLSTVGLRDYKNDCPWGLWLQQRAPQPQTVAKPWVYSSPPRISHSNHCWLVLCDNILIDIRKTIVFKNLYFVTSALCVHANFIVHVKSAVKYNCMLCCIFWKKIVLYLTCRKVEDLQFTAEEAAIDRSDLEVKIVNTG